MVVTHIPETRSVMVNGELEPRINNRIRRAPNFDNPSFMKERGVQNVCGVWPCCVPARLAITGDLGITVQLA